jgi:hypothetical protein
MPFAILNADHSKGRGRRNLRGVVGPPDTIDESRLGLTAHKCQYRHSEVV